MKKLFEDMTMTKYSGCKNTLKKVKSVQYSKTLNYIV